MKIQGANLELDIAKLNAAISEKKNLRSTAYLQAIDLISEGEIEGLADSLKSIYLDETPIEALDGTMNFTGVTVTPKTGTQDQDYVPGFTAVENEISVGVEATHSTPVIRQITDPDIDAVRITISLPQLLNQNQSSGEITGNTVDIKIEVQPNGGAYSTAVEDTIIGKAQSKFQKSYRVDLTGSAPWNIKVTRVSSDSTHTYDLRKTFFDSYTEIIDVKLRYPNSAYVALKIDSSQFSSIPTRAYDVKLLKIKIPDNATVRDDGSLTFSGVWTGNFQVAWCSDPAWIYYDILTESRYGCGSFISESQVDKWALYTISQYCSEQISDGEGGLEPRFSCNMYLQTQQDAYKVLQDLTSCFRGMSYWSSGTVNISQDAPQDAVYLYTNANVVNGLFTYSGASAKARHSVALVTWNDPEDFYRAKVEYVEDQSAVEAFGIVKTQVTAFGCTSRSQAHRAGKWILYTEQNESETVSFKTGIEGCTARPGQIVKVLDESRAGIRLGGRIHSATSTTLTVDALSNDNYGGYILSVLLPSGIVQTSTVSSNTGNVLTVASAFGVTPTAGSIWALSSSVVEAQTFRILGMVESQGGVFEITGLKYDSNKYDAVENNIKLEPRNYSVLSALPPAPTNLTLTESLFSSPSGVRTKITLSWEKVDTSTTYFVRYYKDNENPITVPDVLTNNLDLVDVTPGLYTFQVFSVSPLGKFGQPAVLTGEVYGKTAPPTDVSNFSITPTGTTALLTWTQSTDLDVLVGGFVRIRYTPNLVDQAWKDSVDIVEAVPGNATSVQAPLLDGTYLIKFVDSTDNESVNATQIISTVAAPLTLNIVDTETESPTFPGVKTNTVYASDLNGLILSGNQNIDDMGMIDDLSDIDSQGGIQSSGSYNFLNTIDLGSVYSSKLTAMIKVEGYDIGSLIDSITSNIDDWSDIDGLSLSSGVNAELFVRTTQDNPASSPTWSDWNKFFIGEYLARGFQFRLDLTSDDPSHNILVTGLSVVIDMPDRIEDRRNITSGVGTYPLTFDFPFYAVPTLNVTPQDMTSGDKFTISGQATTGFSIIFKDSSGTTVSRVFDVIAKGYGRKVA